ncbi:YfbM family protein [Catellatospora sichuanensis]|uniref:YfbM family protein n=1 Tax=Catellatospora sichuanensis TaxID=1969805 RepID=UPI001FE419F5|nr:YfbM family protein [Catellatospora sichuanensis]
MGMYGLWLRVSPAELERAKSDLDWAYELADEAVVSEKDSDISERRSFGTDKAWHALSFLLDRAEFPVSIIRGEEWFVDDLDDPEADWGYGAPCYLTPEQVRQASTALADVSEGDLIRGVDVSELARAEIYPAVWESQAELDWAVGDLPDIKTYFASAADAGDAVICWIG